MTPMMMSRRRIGGVVLLAWCLVVSSSSSDCPSVPVEEVLTRLSGRPFDESLGSCALVGGSSILEGSRQGPRIEAQDTVIRVNRLPHPRHFGDVGKRTDIYFVNLLSKFRPLATRLEWETGSEPSAQWCAHAADCTNFTSGPKSIIFEGAPFDTFWKIGDEAPAGPALTAPPLTTAHWGGHLQRQGRPFRDNNDFLAGRPPAPPRGRYAIDAAKAAVKAFAAATDRNDGQKPPPFPGAHTVARQSHALHFFEHNLPVVPYAFDEKVDKATGDRVHEWGYTSKPSGGLKAFLTFANLCDSITLFGFGGSNQSIDGHQEFGHNFQAEHRFYDTLVQLGEQQETTEAPRPSGENDDKSTSFFPTSFHGEPRLSPYFRHFADRILCLARRRHITVVH